MAFFQTYVFSSLCEKCRICPKGYIFKFMIYMYLKNNEFDFPRWSPPKIHIHDYSQHWATKISVVSLTVYQFTWGRAQEENVLLKFSENSNNTD